MKAAILVESKKPLTITNIDLPAKLDAGQVLVKLHYSGICGAQINEIDAAKGPDKFLPGTKMPVQRVTDSKELMQLVDYLKTVTASKADIK